MYIYLVELLDFDRKTTRYFASLDCPWLKKSMGILTHLGSGTLWIAIYAFLIAFQDQLFPIIFVFILAEIIGLLITVLLKYTTKRSRPDIIYNSSWHSLLKYSFPSHHSLRAFMIAVILGTTYPAFLPFLIFAASMISFSRVYLLKHYLSDVFAGALFGIIIGFKSLIIMS